MLLLIPVAVNAQQRLPGAETIPTFLVTSNTKQFYRFHFSGLQAPNAIKLANQLSIVAQKLPAENPLRQAILHTKDAATFAEDYRVLRSCFLEQHIDTLYFQVEEHWIDSITLPGYLIMPGTPETVSKLRARLERAGLAVWARYLEGFAPASEKGWMVRSWGKLSPGGAAPEKVALIQHSLRTRLPVRPASVVAKALPLLQVQLTDTQPVTLVTLERNRLDAVSSLLLPALAPDFLRTMELSSKALASSMVIVVNPMPCLLQVAHMPTSNDAQQLGKELQRSINARLQQFSSKGDDLEKIIIGVLGTTMVIEVRDKDVLMLLKPPVLFDMEAASREQRSSQEQDWSALTLPPACTGNWWAPRARRIATM